MLVVNATSWSGHDFSHAPGDLIDLPVEVARARCEAGLAQPAEAWPEPVVEPPAETVTAQAEPATAAPGGRQRARR